VRNAALEAIAITIQSQRRSLLDANERDLSAAHDAGLDAALIDRLELTETRIDGMLESLAIVQALPDPIGGIEGLKAMESGHTSGQDARPARPCRHHL
jgi:glutamate-5-semialdehyde dehydrogenase